MARTSALEKLRFPQMARRWASKSIFGGWAKGTAGMGDFHPLAIGNPSRDASEVVSQVSYGRAFHDTSMYHKAATRANAEFSSPRGGR
jgi:hypothetical protein